MKFKFIIAAIIFIAASSALYAWWYFSNYHNISFDLKTQPLEVHIVDSDDKTVITLTQNTVVTLRDGDYKAYPIGDNVDTAPIKFETNEKKTHITIDPSISFKTLSSNLDQEYEDIKAAIITKYPSIIAQFNIGRGQLLRQADWYVGVLTYKSSSNDNPKDRYKIILRKDSDGWQVVGSPQIIPTKYNFPSVPDDVLKSAYNLLPDTL